MLLNAFPRDGDFGPMTGFGFAWRWTDPKYDPLPPEALASIKPLRPMKVREIWNWERRLLDTNMQSLSARLFIIERQPDQQSAASIAAWLSARLMPPAELIVVSFQPEEAVSTTGATFIRYRDSFCYPGTYDVTIWPQSQPWGLLYHHDEVFYYGVWRTEAE